MATNIKSEPIAANPITLRIDTVYLPALGL
jgi:hypothetical protein